MQYTIQSDNVITQYYMNVEFSQMHTVLMLIFINIKYMLLLCYHASLIQRNATCSYLNIIFYVNKNPYDCYRIINTC